MKESKLICISKNRYESLDVARAIAKDFLMENGMKNKPYLCPVCQGFHLTSESNKQYGRAHKKILKRKKMQNFNYHSRKHRRAKK